MPSDTAPRREVFAGPPDAGAGAGTHHGADRPAGERGRSLVRRILGLGEGLAMASGLAMALLHLADVRAVALQGHEVVPGVRLAGQDVGGIGAQALRDQAQALGHAALDRPLTLSAGPARVRTSARALGADPVIEASVASALAVGRSGDPWIDLRDRVAASRGEVDLPIGYRFVDGPALDALLALAPQVDRPSLPTRLDLERRKVLPATAGSALLAYDSLSSVAVGLAEGVDHIDLVVQRKPAVEDPLGALADALDVSVVLGSFDTPYSTSDADRSHNLKVGSTAIDGVVLQPGELFSFNEVVGPRSAEAGYRYATGIEAGELVDTMGGGICQVSSTLFGAAFFAGLEVVRARPHSRPSSYVDMGLDSTVVYPDIDMKLRNGFDFPVVLHMTVSQGRVRAEVLGPRRPYQVAFERELVEVLPYSTVWRHDDHLRSGTESVAQRGMRGFKVKRIRKLYQGGEVIKEEDWELRYPPTTEILRRGTNPAGQVPEVQKAPPLRDPATALRVVQ
ncbi:VanW family protein [Paraliomyxa miuraensis]|uniref:VanW family protein n=1 Tax=Paraliomyxa miuraensis TaxID=376150 RepID=UPI00224CE359|nr:VanW family protein [Paraliomyxa miuraensis]MCX4245653.1 VanW family protein [Paraliomyxa miuraensis]